MKKVIIIIWILGVVTLAGLIAYSESFSQPNEEPNNTIRWDEEIVCDKIISLDFHFSDVNNVDEAAAALRELYCPKVKAKEVIDIEVTINDETHTASFEDFFEWMGFKDKDDCTKDNLTYCITKFGDGTIEKIELISPKDPNCLMTVDDFMFKLLVERHIEPERR